MKIILIPMLPTLYGRRYQLSKHLAASGNEVHMILWHMPYPITLQNIKIGLKSSWKKYSYVQDGINIHKVSRLPFFFPFVNRYWFHKQINSIASEFGIQAIISQAFFNEVEPPTNLPLYFDLNDNYEAYARIYGSRAYKLLRVRHTVEQQLRRSTAVFAVSDILLNYAKQFNNNVYKIPNGVELVKPSLMPKKLKYGEHSLVYVSTFGKWSMILNVIKTIDKLKSKYPDIQLVLIGGGTEIKAAEQLIKNKNIQSNVHLIGPLYDRSKVFEIIKNCKVCLNISDKNEFRDSASPIKIFEYSSLGKTIVSTNMNEVVSLALPNVITYTADKQSIQLESAIVKAFKTRRDNLDVQRKIAANYSWDVLTDQMLAIINQAYPRVNNDKDILQ